MVSMSRIPPKLSRPGVARKSPVSGVCGGDQRPAQLPRFGRVAMTSAIVAKASAESASWGRLWVSYEVSPNRVDFMFFGLKLVFP
jgi:hypothetical protein